MRKLLVVVFLAAVVGIVITKVHRSSAAQARAARDAAAAKPVTGVHTEAPEVLVRASAEAPPTRVAARTVAAPVERQPQFLSASTVLPARPPAAAVAPLAPAAPAAPAATAPAPAAAAVVAAPATPAAPRAAYVDAGATGSGPLAQVQALLKAGKRVEARDVLTPLYVQSTGAQAAQLRGLLDTINSDLVFNPRCTEGATAYTVAGGDSLVRIGKKYGVNWRMIGLLNGMDEKSLLRAGQKLQVLEGQASIIVHRGEFRLDLLWNGAYVKSYTVGIGKPESPTPDGQFTVRDMVIRAPWTKPGGGVVKYGEEGYALGERWMGFENKPGANGLGIHGTNDESTVGTRCSNGCVRLRNADVMELYNFVDAGTQVTIQE